MSEKASVAASSATPVRGDLLRQTLRMTALLVGACVVVVGTLSLLAVFITSKAVGPSRAEVLDLAEPTTVSPTAKKPVSI